MLQRFNVAHASAIGVLARSNSKSRNVTGSQLFKTTASVPHKFVTSRNKQALLSTVTLSKGMSAKKESFVKKATQTKNLFNQTINPGAHIAKPSPLST